jgi:hypothetical protein
MSLMKHPVMTEKNLAAHRLNARQSNGPNTPEGRERARAANLRHGYYSEGRDQALVALGENPEALAALVEGARQQFRPSNAYQEWITDRIASVQWRIGRAERLQESGAADHIQKRESKRREAAREPRGQFAAVQDFLDSVRRAAARADFYAPTGCFPLGQRMMELNPSANMDQILHLLYQLRRPARFSKPLPPPLPDAMSDQEWHDTLQDGLTGESAVPCPDIPIAQKCDRDPLREQLWNLASTERLRLAEGWGREIAAYEAPLPPRLRDLCAIEISKELELLRREERSCIREFSRLVNELRKVQKEAATPQAQAKLSDQPPQEQASNSEDEAEEMADEAAEQMPENEGTSGDVAENTEEVVAGEVAMGAASAARIRLSEPTLPSESSEKPVEADLRAAAMAAKGYFHPNAGASLEKDGAKTVEPSLSAAA